SAATYADQLRACHVIVDQDERATIIREGATQAAAAADLILVADEALVAENAGLTEWPVPLLGRFDAAFLAVPPEVIRLTAKLNQKYFMCTSADGKLANAFVCTANIAASDGGTSIVAGNERVLAARLSDAKFFYEQDLKTPLAIHAEKLKDIVFHEKLGTVADKVERVALLARTLCYWGIVKGDPALAEQAARLCKADLVTGMVGEFPELQGIMGGYYARAEGLPDAVADAIRDHYKPVGQGDEVPTAPVTVAVSLADKLDTLACFFVIDERPTGSKDPYALRRAVLGVIHLLVANNLHMDWRSVLRAFLQWFDKQRDGKPMQSFEPSPPEYQRPFEEKGELLIDFLIDRLKVQQREAGVRHDLIDAVFAAKNKYGPNENNLARLLARVRALQAFITTEDGANLLAGYKRAANILKQAGAVPETTTVPDGLEPADRALRQALDAAEARAAESVWEERFEEAMSVLATLRAPIDQFFTDVMVNAEDAAVRAFRLGLLARFRDAVHQVAYFSKIEG
ncbi:MAG: glycine--tRNA ligase subunit beta, partial [Alphaproteobacteria bacterium]|nr:glycine--tRNA ligase subunit beta [Alphaproteobacteria bacterium]